jgi:hypothetical protein
LLPALLENPSVSEVQLGKLAIGAARDSIESMLNSARVRSLKTVLETLRANPFLKKEEADELKKLLRVASPGAAPAQAPVPAPQVASTVAHPEATAHAPESTASPDVPPDPEDEEAVAAYLKEHADDIAAEGDKPFKPVGGIVELLGEDYFPVTQEAEAPASAPVPEAPKPAAAAKKPVPAPGRENALQKIARLDIKGRIQLALKGSKEERSLLIRDGTKIVALAVLEAPKLSDGEVEKFASQKNVLESVLRQIPMKRRFMKNYKVVRNLVANPRTPMDLALGLMKHLLSTDLKNIGTNKDVPETVRKLAFKMYKQKEEQASKK